MVPFTLLDVELDRAYKGYESVLFYDAGSGAWALPTQQRLTISVEIMSSMLDQSYNFVMLRAAATVHFFGFLRLGKITVPSVTAFDEGIHLD